jgi:hypothetical protein
MTVYGNCSVNDTPSLVHLVACAAGAVAVPIQDRAAQQDNQHTTSITVQVRRGRHHS